MTNVFLKIGRAAGEIAGLSVPQPIYKIMKWNIRYNVSFMLFTT